MLLNTIAGQLLFRHSSAPGVLTTGELGYRKLILVPVSPIPPFMLLQHHGGKNVREPHDGLD
jgi:hypothetical protein